MRKGHKSLCSVNISVSNNIPASSEMGFVCVLGLNYEPLFNHVGHFWGIYQAVCCQHGTSHQKEPSETKDPTVQSSAPTEHTERISAWTSGLSNTGVRSVQRQQTSAVTNCVLLFAAVNKLQEHEKKQGQEKHFVRQTGHSGDLSAEELNLEHTQHQSARSSSLNDEKKQEHTRGGDMDTLCKS